MPALDTIGPFFKNNVIDLKGEELRVIIYKELSRVFSKDEVMTKWPASKGRKDDFDPIYMYAPETDIVVKPFNIERRVELDKQKINFALIRTSDFVKRINRRAEIKIVDSHFNDNPRVFIAIEVGGSGSEKHLLGDLYNASILGKIGIIVCTSKTSKTYKRIYEFTKFAYSVGKPTQGLRNVAIIREKEFIQILKETLSGSLSLLQATK